MDQEFKWDQRFLGLAEHVAKWSRDPSTKVGAVITDDRNRIISLGYNGFPRGVLDSEERLNNREEKYPRVVHAERNALLFAGKSLDNAILYTWPMQPCAACAGMVIQAGIQKVVTIKCDNERWQREFKISEEMFREAGVKLVIYENQI
jgi:dCMP deaminase